MDASKNIDSSASEFNTEPHETSSENPLLADPKAFDPDASLLYTAETQDYKELQSMSKVDQNWELWTHVYHACCKPASYSERGRLPSSIQTRSSVGIFFLFRCPNSLHSVRPSPPLLAIHPGLGPSQPASHHKIILIFLSYTHILFNISTFVLKLRKTQKWKAAKREKKHSESNYYLPLKTCFLE